MKNHTALFATTAVALCVGLASTTGCGSSTTATTTSSHASTSNASSGSPASTGSSTSSGNGGANAGSTSNTSTSASTSTSSGAGGANPAPPTIGMQLDRIGRPAVNTALNHAFDGTAAAGTAKDAYNHDSDPTMWKASYTAQFEANLAIIDALDGTCGNQLGYASPASATSYGLIGGALTDDRLYLNTAGADSTQYLAVEANALNVLKNADQGGRKLNLVVMDTTYSLLAAGALTGVSNGITSNDVAFSTAFPYEAVPH